MSGGKAQSRAPGGSRKPRSGSPAPGGLNLHHVGTEIADRLGGKRAGEQLWPISTAHGPASAPGGGARGWVGGQGAVVEAVRFELTEELPPRQFSRLQP